MNRMRLDVVGVALCHVMSHDQLWLFRSLEPRLTFKGGGEREPGTHCLRMRKVYGAISSIIRRTLSLPRSLTCTDKVY